MEPRMENGARTRDLDRKETGSLIGSDKVEGTSVYGLGEDKIGKIERIMIDKQSGKVAYAVLSFGGFLGIGDEHYPIPWGKLTYDEGLGGYRTDISKDTLEGAPRYRSDDDFDWENREASLGVYNHYGMPPYWI